MKRFRKFYIVFSPIRQFIRLVCVLLLASLVSQITPVFAQVFNSGDLNSIINETPFYDPSTSSTTTPIATSPGCGGGSNGYGGSFDQWLQAVAEVESGGSPTIITSSSDSNASGLYQWLTTTWVSNATAYPPAEQYPRAYLAPADVQFAVAYLNYGEALKSIEGQANLLAQNDNPFYWLSVEHFIPAALTNFSDLYNSYGGETPDVYAKLIIADMQNGVGSTIQLTYAQAPDFEVWLAKDGGPFGTDITTVASTITSLTDSCDPNNGGIPSTSFVFYSQADPLWVNYPYGPDGDIGSSGCGPTSVAEVVATMVNSSITPLDTAAWGNANGSDEGGGSIWQIMLIDGPEHWGLKSTEIGLDMSQAISILNNGGLIIITGAGTAPFTPDGHILVLRGINSSGNFLVGDPNSPPSNPGNPENSFSASELLSAGLTMMFGITK